MVQSCFQCLRSTDPLGWVRGKIARFLAGKASIAVRVDHFEGDPWSKKQVGEINKEINAIRKEIPPAK